MQTKYLLIVMLMFIPYGPAATSDMCVSHTLRVTAVKGTVGYETDQAMREPTANAMVELREDQAEPRVIATTLTDKNGRFDFGALKAATYLVYIEAPGRTTYFGFRVELSNSRELQSAERSIDVTLGFGIEGCRGSVARYGAARTN